MERSAVDSTAHLANGPTACLAMGWTVHPDADRMDPVALGLVVAAGCADYADPPEYAAADRLVLAVGALAGN